MNCREFKIKVEESDQASLVAMSHEANAHMTNCGECRRFREQRLTLAELLNDLPQISAPSTFEFRLRARLADRHAPHSTIDRARGLVLRVPSAPSALSIGLAAIFAGTVTLLFYFNQYQLPALVTEENNRGRIAEASAIAPDIVNQTEIANMSAPDVHTSSPDSIARGNEEVLDEILSAQRGKRVLPIVASYSNARPQRTVAPVARVARQPRIFSEPNTETNSQVGSSLSSVRPATLTPTLSPAQTESPTFDVDVHLPIARPRVRVRDARGGARMMQVDSVTFGSQELVGRDRAPSAHMRETKW